MDVLDIMDSDADKAYEHRRSKGSAGEQHANMRSRLSGEARAAVAELIEAAELIELRYSESGNQCAYVGGIARLRDAISAVRPSQGDGGGKGEGEKVG